MGVAACGAEEETELVDGEEIHSVVEGEPLELGDLGFNVALTRFLNPEDTDRRRVPAAACRRPRSTRTTSRSS